MAIAVGSNDKVINLQRSQVTAIIALGVACLSLYAALAGVLNEKLYKEVLEAGTITEFLVAGSLAQDIISIVLGLVLAVLSVFFLRKPGDKIFIAILGLTSYFFYGYGLYVIQGQYTSLYLIYLANFGLSIYSLIWGLTSFNWKAVNYYSLPKVLRFTIGGFLIMILGVLTPVWLIRMLPDITRNIPGDTYAVFILDLAIEFPAFGIIAVQLFRGKPFGYVLAGLALFKVLTICLSVAFGEWFVAFYGGFKPDYGMIAIFSLLTVISFSLIILYLSKFKNINQKDL